jgi:ribonuclease HI
MLEWFSGMKEEELCLSIMILYQLWLARNEAREEVQIADPHEIIRKTLFLVEEWQGLKPERAVCATREVEHWIPPQLGWTKMNVDGAFSATDGTGGCGVVLRDHNGSFVAGASHFFRSSPDPERTELMACRHALILARSLNLGKVSLESDCLGAVAKIRSCDIDRSMHGPLVEEIKSMLKNFAEHSVRHVRRSGNKVAHVLARYGCENKCNVVWGPNPPEFLVTVLAPECAV